MPVIAIDASRLEPQHKTGVEYYSYFLLRELKKIIPTEYKVILYSRQPIKNVLGDLPVNWQNKVLSWPPKYLWSQIRLAYQLWQDRPSLCFIPSHVIPFFAPGNFAATIHDISWLNFPQSYRRRSRWYLRFSTWITAKRARVVLTISDFSRIQITDHYPQLKNKIFVTHLAGTINSITDVTKVENYLVILGRVERKKNIGVVLDAWHQLSQNNKNFSTKLYLIGKTGLGARDILDRLAQPPFKGRVEWLGWLPLLEMAKYLRNSKGLLFPGKGEGFGIPVLDAWAAKVPLAAASSGALPEVVGQAGLLVPDNVTAWVAAIEELCYNDNVRNKLVQAGSLRLSEFSWEKTAATTWRIFRLILEQPNLISQTHISLDDD